MWIWSTIVAWILWIKCVSDKFYEWQVRTCHLHTLWLWNVRKKAFSMLSFWTNCKTKTKTPNICIMSTFTIAYRKYMQINISNIKQFFRNYLSYKGKLQFQIQHFFYQGRIIDEGSIICARTLSKKHYQEGKICHTSIKKNLLC